MNRRNASHTTQGKNSSVEKSKTDLPQTLKKTAFYLEAPSAKSVQLAADFTDWEKTPFAMAKAENGIWRVVVPLASGNYSYRFIVDGQCSDDPHCANHIPNAFGTTNAMRQVL